ncbi:heterokaryon incompatibility protein-domain-containing protein [Nemania sp. FL0916]|nr:heterokaryon incompatibility protein-domain-containing protein [Nemania sp. FL0916]
MARSDNRCPLNVCNDLIQTIHAKGREKKHGRSTSVHVKMKEVEEAVEAGCLTCRLFLNAILCVYPGGAIELFNHMNRSPGQRFYLYGSDYSSLQFSEKVYFGYCTVKLYAPEGLEPCSWPLPPLPKSKRDPRPEGKMDFIKCRPNNISNGGNASLPKRVLDVSPPGGQIRLWEPLERDTSQYICLSHRWGESQPLKTTLNNIRSFKHDIPWDSVPQLFKDAIYVVRKLGIRYVWIDSLCIIQDERQDWEEQARRMCDIYRNSFLTIAATRCKGCSDTLFPRFDRTVHGYDEKGNPLVVAVRMECPHLHPEISKYPLLTRAWVLQERILSKRVIHFGYDEIFWECTESTSCECSKNIILGPSDLQQIRRQGYEKATTKDCQQVWYQILDRYSRLKLTFPSDRQPAILGLAKEMASKRQGRYLAGLWEDTLISDLAWRTNRITYRDARKRSQEMGPFWSWVSVPSICLYPSNWVDGSTVVVAIQEFYQVLGPQIRLTLRGWLASGISRIKSNWDDNWDDRFNEFTREMPENQWFRRSFDLTSRLKVFFRPDVFWETYLPHGQPVYCLTIGCWANMRQRFESGLVLQCIDNKDQLYERIGIVDLELPTYDRVYERASRLSSYREVVKLI